MRLPRKRAETRAAANGGGDFFNAVLAQIEAQAATKGADAGGTAAIEAAAGQLARALAGATCDHPAVTPMFLAQYGRDLIRGGASLHRIDIEAGALTLTPCAQWHWIGRTANPETWTVNATDYGPSGSRTDWLPYSGVVWGCWGRSAATPWVGRSPSSWAGLTAKVASEAERSIGDESSGPITNIVPVPEAGAAEGDEADPLAKLRADIAAKRGQLTIVETTAAGWGEGQTGAPQRDWKPARLGPDYPAAVVEAARDGFARLLAAAGSNVSLFTDADGTAQREALRRWHMGTVLPIAAILEAELSAKLDEPVTLTFDSYALDIAGRAASFRQLVTAGMDVTQALAITGLLSDEP